MWKENGSFSLAKKERGLTVTSAVDGNSLTRLRFGAISGSDNFLLHSHFFRWFWWNLRLLDLGFDDWNCSACQFQGSVSRDSRVRQRNIFVTFLFISFYILFFYIYGRISSLFEENKNCFFFFFLKKCDKLRSYCL